MYLNNNKLFFLGLLLVVVVAALPLFGHLGEFPIQIFDEQRLATNALEMKQSGHVIVTTYDGLPDYWNPKPPMMIWLLAISLRLLGNNELALRIPSAIAACITCLFLFRVLAKILQDHIAGILCILILLTAEGYVMLHGTRTGDYDALLTLFTTCFCLNYFRYTEHWENKYLYRFFAFLCLSVLTKGIAPLMLMPALFLFTLWKKGILQTLRNKNFYLGLLLFIIPVAGYYCIRQHYDAGYFKSVSEMELGGRFLKTLNNKQPDHLFYIRDIVHRGFRYWWVFIVPGFICGLFSPNKSLRSLTILSGLICFCFITTLSLAATRFNWYLLPVYPFMSVLVFVFFYSILQWILPRQKVNVPAKNNITWAAFIVLITIIPYKNILDKTLNQQSEEWNRENQQMGFFMKDILEHKKNIQDCCILMEGYEGNIRLYMKLLALDNRPVCTVKKEQIRPGMKIIAYEDYLKAYLETAFNTHISERYRDVPVYEINGIK